MKVGRLKSYLEDALDILNDYDDEQEIVCHPNTYRIDVPYIGTYDGFIEFSNIQVEDNDYEVDSAYSVSEDKNNYRVKIITDIPANSINDGIFGSVFGQIIDGIWENSSTMKKYYDRMSYGEINNNLYLSVNILFYTEAFNDNAENVLKWFAQKIKQIVMKEQKFNSEIEWKRDNKTELTFIENTEDGTPITVSDCYRVYNALLNRKPRILD